MKTHILMLQEREKLQKLIGSLTKADQLMLLYPAEDDTVSIKDFQLFANAKCKVQFIEAPNVNGVPEIGLAYVYGKIMGQYPDAIIDSADPLFKQLKGDVPAKPKRTRKPAAKAEKEEFSMPKPIEPDEVKQEPKRRGRKKANQEGPSGDSGFDAAFEKMQTALAALKKDGFDPSLHIGSICKAIALMDQEKISFTEAIEACSTKATANKINAALKGSVDEIAKIAREVNGFDK